MRIHFFQLGRGSRSRRTLAVAVLGTVALPATLLLAGCGQNFEQEGGVAPVPRPTIDGLSPVTPAPQTDVPSEPPIGPGYAPPRTDAPTQTAVPNLPGGKDLGGAAPAESTP